MQLLSVGESEALASLRRLDCHCPEDGALITYPQVPMLPPSRTPLRLNQSVLFLGSGCRDVRPRQLARIGEKGWEGEGEGCLRGEPPRPQGLKVVAALGNVPGLQAGRFGVRCPSNMTCGTSRRHAAGSADTDRHPDRYSAPIWEPGCIGQGVVGTDQDRKYRHVLIRPKAAAALPIRTGIYFHRPKEHC